MSATLRRKIFFIAGGVLALLLLVGGIALALFNPALTRYVEGPEFRAELEKQTAKGLHFPNSRFGPIRRTGFLSAASPSFQAEDGRKAMTSFDAKEITARFNPLGVFLRRWQLDELHIGTGEVGIQIYEPKPSPTPAKPWYHVFLPDRVHLRRVWSDPADVTWSMQGKQGGIFGTHLEVTPHGRDFEYRATGGTFKNALVPDLDFVRTHLLITKEKFTIHDLQLASEKGTFHGEGTAETRGEKKVDFRGEWEALPIAPWLPADWRKNISGTTTGDLHWTGQDFKIETATINGKIRIDGGRARDLRVLRQIAAVTESDSFKQLRFDVFTAELSLEKGDARLQDIHLEEKGKFRIEGTVSVQKKKSLSGSVRLGLHPAHLAWLPKAEEVFTESRDGYLWTTVRLSGTLDAPEQDLSPRILDALDDSPGAFLGAAFRALGAWLGGK